MSTLRTICKEHTHLSDAEILWLELLTIDWALLADLALGDVVLWVPTGEGKYLSIAHSRPSALITVFYRDIVGEYLKESWKPIVDKAIKTRRPAAASTITWHEDVPMQVTAFAVSRRDPETREKIGPFAAITLHTSPQDLFSASKISAAYRESADDLFNMMQDAFFPNIESGLQRPRGAPRAVDGLIRIDEQGEVLFASPNTLTSFARLGFRSELEGKNLSQVLAEITKDRYDTNEYLPIVARAQRARRVDIEHNGRVVTMRSIPVIVNEQRIGGIILTRDITDLRAHSQELITKDATIREIHHRVKNNLQTVASLLRLQARRAHSEEGKAVLEQAMRRVSSIAVVHDSLASGVTQNVHFDDIFDRLCSLVADVATVSSPEVRIKRIGTFGDLGSEYATPLALALTELMTNAIEHGLSACENGTVEIDVTRREDGLQIEIYDNGVGLQNGKIGDGLGTQIIRTLIEGELRGTIHWQNAPEQGTQVSIWVPFLWNDTQEISYILQAES